MAGEGDSGQVEQGEGEQVEVEQGGEGEQGEGAGGDALQAELDKWKAQARKREKRAKENAGAAAELEKVKRQSMSEQEQAVAAALDAGRAEGLKAGAGKVAAAEIKAALAGRGVDAEALIEGIDPAKFLDDDGEIDQPAIIAWVERVAPKVEEPDMMAQQFPDLGQGKRTADAGKAAALNGDPLLQALKDRVGAR